MIAALRVWPSGVQGRCGAWPYGEVDHDQQKGSTHEENEAVNIDYSEIAFLYLLCIWNV